MNEDSQASTSSAKNDQADTDDNVECKIEIPMVVFSTASQSEEGPTETTDDECDRDCDSFDSADVIKFAWQIARGMVCK